eukprot:scaffold2.g6794.t1
MRLRGDRLLAAEAAASDAAPLALRTRRAPDRLADTQDQPKPQLWPHEKAIVTAAEAQELARLEAEQVAAFQRHELQLGDGNKGAALTSGTLGLGDAGTAHALELLGRCFPADDDTCWQVRTPKPREKCRLWADPIPGDARTALQKKGHRLLDFSKLCKIKDGHAFLLIMRRYFRTKGWFESKYMPLGLTAVKRVAEEEPEHADVFGGLRLVFDLTGGRTFFIKSGDQVLLETTAKVWFAAAAQQRAEAAAPDPQAARAAAAEGGASDEASVLQHCFWCGTPDAKYTYMQVDSTDGTGGGGAPVQRWCLACHQACERGGLWGEDDSNGEGSGERERPAVAAGVCSPAGCSGCTLAELPAKAQKIRETKRSKKRRRKDHGWGDAQKRSTQKRQQKKSDTA